jgi:hypothetical protein
MVTLPDGHHYVRYCKPTQIHDGKVLTSAFYLREKDTDGLSGDHFEHCNKDYQQILESLRARGFNPSKNGYFAKLNCGEVICMAQKAQKNCEISFTKDNENHSHTLMIGLTIGDDLIPALLVTLVEVEPLNNYETDKIERK